MLIRLNNCYFYWTLLYFLVSNQDMNVILSFNLRVDLAFNVAVVTFIYNILGFKGGFVESPLRINFKTFFIFEFFDILIIIRSIVINLNLMFTTVNDNCNRNHSLQVSDSTWVQICIHFIFITQFNYNEVFFKSFHFFWAFM